MTSFFLLAFAAGVASLQQQAALPEYPLVWLLVGCAGMAAVGVFRRRARRFLLLASVVAGMAAGWGYAAYRAELRLADALAPEWEIRDVRVAGTVASLPARFLRGERFAFQVEEVLTPGARIPSRLWLSFYTRGRYDNQDTHDTAVSSPPLPKAGERWEFTLRLKRPHGGVNPHGGFDYEAWLLEHGYRATGYVRQTPAPQRLESRAGSPILGAHRLREYLRERMLPQDDADSPYPYAGIPVALAIGDQQAIPQTQWDIFNRTGTTHLMSISGLHVTFVAGLFGWLIARLWRRWPRLCLFFPAQRAAILGGALAALFYGLLSGLSVPAQRACLMLGVAALALLLCRRVGIARILLLALTAVLLYDPWAVLTAGFWLSFGIVAALCWIGQHTGQAENEGNEEVAPGPGRRLLRWISLFSAAQWAATLATLPLLIFLFQRFPLVSPLANLLAIPWISFLVTPLALLAAAFSWLPFVSSLLLSAAHFLLVPLMAMLAFLAAAPQFSTPAAPLWCVALAACGIFILLMPRGMPGKVAGIFLLLPLLLRPPAPSLSAGEVRLTLFDVGQGQAALLETARHRLLYDAGPLYDPGDRQRDIPGRDAAMSVILPHFTATGIQRLDMLVVSHRDNDHAGGLPSLAAGIPIGEILSSAPHIGNRLCRQGESWQWDEVRFEFLHPPVGKDLRGDNGDSCVLKVSAPGGRLLLTGDIGAREEKRLLREQAAALSAEILLVPHHGSRHSSTLPFIAAVGADWALFSAGYRNRFNHPHPDTLARYERLDTAPLRTDLDGALSLTVTRQGIETRRWREERKRYWRDPSFPRATQAGTPLSAQESR